MDCCQCWTFGSKPMHNGKPSRPPLDSLVVNPEKPAVKIIHSRIEAAVGNGSHEEAVMALMNLAVADCEASVLRKEERVTGLEFRRALQRLIDGVQQLSRPRESKRRRTNTSTSTAVTALPVLRPCPLPPLEASEFLLKDTVLPNSAIRKAVVQLRRGRYHPSVALYADIDRLQSSENISLYTPDLIREEWSHNVKDGHYFTMLHIIHRLQLSFTYDAVQRLDDVFSDFLRHSSLADHPPLETIPVFPNREWVRVPCFPRTTGTRRRQPVAPLRDVAWRRWFTPRCRAAVTDGTERQLETMYTTRRPSNSRLDVTG